jgi:predicted permease
MTGPVTALRIVSIIFPVFAVVFTGWAYGKHRPADMTFINQLNMEIFLPALVFGQLASRSFDLARYQGLAWGVLLMVAGSGLLGWALARGIGVAPKTFVPSMMFNNCGNLGLPLAALAFGDAALAPAVVMLLVTNLIQFSFGNWLLDHHARWWNIWRVPVVMATFAGLAYSFTGRDLWQPLQVPLKMLGDVSIPLLLFALGVRIAQSHLKAFRIGVIGALARPAIGLGLTTGIALLLGLHGQERAMLLLYGALPPAVLNYIFAERYFQGPDEVSAIVIVGNIAAVAIIPLVLAFVL